MSLVLALGEKQKWLSTAAVYHCLELIGSETLSPSRSHATLFWHTTLRYAPLSRTGTLLFAVAHIFSLTLPSVAHSRVSLCSSFPRLSTEYWVSVSKFELRASETLQFGLGLRVLRYVQALLVILSNAKRVSSIISLVSSLFSWLSVDYLVKCLL